MRRRATAAFAAVALAGLAVLAIAAARDERDLAFSLGVAPGLVAAELAPGTAACQRPVEVAAEFDGVSFQVGTYRRPGQRLLVTVERADGGETLARGELPGGYPDVSQPDVALDATVPAGERVAVCVRNEGNRKIALYGNGEVAHLGSEVEVDGGAQPTDLTLVFTTGERSVLSQLPDVADRAALFHAPWVGPWTFWLLLGLVLVAAPLLLARALGRAFGSDPS